MKIYLFLWGLCFVFASALVAQQPREAESNLCCQAESESGDETVCLNAAEMKSHLLLVEKLKAPCCGKNLREEGVIVASVKVSKEGRVLAFRILEGKPFGSSSLSQVLPTWRFRKVSRHGVLRTVCGPLVVKYHLQDGVAWMNVLGKLPAPTQ